MYIPTKLQKCLRRTKNYYVPKFFNKPYFTINNNNNLPITYATKNTPDVVAPTTVLANVKVQNSGAKAAAIPKTTCVTSDMKNVFFLPYLEKA